MAYVVAHEFGHHVQTRARHRRQPSRSWSRQDPSRRNDLSVRQELQADCLAGVWAHSAAADLEPGDIEEALSAASAVGDDRIRRPRPAASIPRAGPTAPPSSARPWFTTGYRSGNVNDCDTFAPVATCPSRLR